MSRKSILFEKLIEYANSDIYPFCMPGHKRHNAVPFPGADPYQLDITEVDGFDDLHHAEGILKEITDHAAEVYAKGDVKPVVFMSVNGSTACNLAAINCMPEGTILAAANCHRSVPNATKISGKTRKEIAPIEIPLYQTDGGIDPEAVKQALEEDPEIIAVVITSPSYEGFVSDVKSIAEVAHRYGAYLIVDEAHGAHLPFCKDFPESALYLGADIVVHSLHKTMGSFNQTSLAFVNAEELVEPFHEKLLQFMTTSPAYLLMASIEQAISWAEAHEDKFDAYCEKITEVRAALSAVCKGTGLHLIGEEVIGNYGIVGLDRAKIVLCADRMDGETLLGKLLKEHHLQFEKCTDSYALAMTTVWDTDEGFERLVKAVESIAKEL